MSSSLVTVSYLAAAVLFILALGGLSTNETARRGNLFGMIGMVIAVGVTIVAFVTRNYEWLVALMIVGFAPSVLTKYITPTLESVTQLAG